MPKSTKENYVDCATAFLSEINYDRDEITDAKSFFDGLVEFSEHEETPLEKRTRKGGKARTAKPTSKE